MGATVKWRKDRGAWFLYVCANGTRTAKRYGHTAADKRRAERHAREVNREQTRGRLGLQKKEKKNRFDVFAKRWVEEKVVLPAERGLDEAVAPKTAKMHEQMVRLHLAPFLGRRNLREIDSAAIDALETHLIRKETGKKEKTRRLSRRTIDIVLGTLRQILAHAQVQGIVTSNAVDTRKATQVRGKKRGAKARRMAEWKALDSEEREALLAAFQREAPHYFPFVLFLAETGCRISEAITLAWADVDLARSEARVVRHKTGGDADYVELSERLRGTLTPIRPDICPPRLRAFRTPGGSPIHYENFLHRVWDPIVLKVFGPDRRVTPHTLRHTWATLHLSRGTPIEWVRKMGGWSSAKMLLDVYGHFMPREMRGFSNALGRGDATQRNQAAGSE